jgi:hypothetical protein
MPETPAFIEFKIAKIRGVFWYIAPGHGHRSQWGWIPSLRGLELLLLERDRFSPSRSMAFLESWTGTHTGRLVVLARPTGRLDRRPPRRAYSRLSEISTSWRAGGI